MRRNIFTYLLAIAGLAFTSEATYAQRAAGQTPPVSRIETRPNLGSGAYRAPRNEVSKPVTLPQGSIPNPRSASSVGFGASFDGDVIKDVVVKRVELGSPAARAGLQRGDTIVSINNQKFTSQNDAANYLRSFGGDRVNIVAMRNGAYVSLTGNLAAGTPTSPQSRTAMRPNTGTGQSAVVPATNPSANRATPGTRSITNAPGFGFRLGDTAGGMVISQVDQDSLAAATGLRAGDRVMSLGGQRVRNPAEVDRILAGITEDPSLDIMVARDGRAVDLTANLAAYTGFYSTADHNENITNPTAVRQYGNANLEGLQSTLGATFARTPEGDVAVTRVVPNSYAARAGLRQGDYLYGLNGRTIAGPQDIMQFFANGPTDAGINFGIWRDGQNLAIDAALDQAFYNQLATTLPAASGQPIQENITRDAQGNPVVSPAARTAARDPATQQDGTTTRRSLDFNAQPANDSSGFDTNPQNDSTPDVNPGTGSTDLGTGTSTGSNLNTPLVDPQVNPQQNTESSGLNNGTNTTTTDSDPSTPGTRTPSTGTLPPRYDDSRPAGSEHQMEEKSGSSRSRFGNRATSGRDAVSGGNAGATQGAAQGRPATNRPNQSPGVRNRGLNQGNSANGVQANGQQNSNSRFNNSNRNTRPGLNTPNGRNNSAVRGNNGRVGTTGSAFSSGVQPTGGNTGPGVGLGNASGNVNGNAAGGNANSSAGGGVQGSATGQGVNGGATGGANGAGGATGGGAASGGASGGGTSGGSK